MKSLAIALLAVTTLGTGCASFGTKRSGGAQIQKTVSDESKTSIYGDLDERRPELGER